MVRSGFFQLHPDGHIASWRRIRLYSSCPSLTLQASAYSFSQSFHDGFYIEVPAFLTMKLQSLCATLFLHRNEQCSFSIVQIRLWQGTFVTSECIGRYTSQSFGTAVTPHSYSSTFPTIELKLSMTKCRFRNRSFVRTDNTP